MYTIEGKKGTVFVAVKRLGSVAANKTAQQLRDLGWTVTITPLSIAASR